MKRVKIFSLLGLLLGLQVLANAAPALAQVEQGKSIYESKCAICHGSDGKGNGPAASSFTTRPVDFTNPAFWQGNVTGKITDSIENGKGDMPPVDLSSSQIRAVIAYLSHAFK